MDRREFLRVVTGAAIGIAAFGPFVSARAIGVVQSTNSGATAIGGTSKSLAFGSNVTAGNLLIVVVAGVSSSPRIGNVFDTVGTRWRFGHEGFLGSTRSISVWYGMAGASGANTVTTRHVATGAGGSSWLAVIEVSGFSWADIDAISTPTTQATTTSHSCGSITTLTNDTYILACAAISGAFSATPASGFNTRQAIANDLYVQDRISAATETTTATFTTAANESSWALQIAFKNGTAPSVSNLIAQTFFACVLQTGGNRNDVMPAAQGAVINSSVNEETVFPVRGRLKNLYVVAETIQTTGTIVLSISKNSAICECTVTLDSSGTIEKDIANVVNVEAGDIIGFRAVTTGATGTELNISMDWIPDEPGIAIYAMNGRTFAADPAFVGLYHGTSTEATTASDLLDAFIGAAGDVIAIGCSFGGAPTATTLTLLKNNVEQDGTGGTIDARYLPSAQYGFIRFATPVPVAVEDDVKLKHTGTEFRTWSIAIKATTPGKWNMGSNTRTEANTTGTVSTFYPPHGGDMDDRATETLAAYYCGPTPIVLGGLYVRVDAPGAGKSVIVTVRKNGAATGIVVTISDTNIEGTAGGPVSLVEGDYFTVEQHSSGTPTSAIAPIRWAFTDAQAITPPSGFNALLV